MSHRFSLLRLRWAACSLLSLLLLVPVLPARADGNMQPDLQIRSAGNPDYLGDNIYQTVDGQTVTRSATPGIYASFHVVIQNDGPQADGFTITGPAGSSGWTILYLDALRGGQNVTQAVTGAGWSVGSLPAGGQREFRIEVKATAGVPQNDALTIQLTAVSQAAPSRFDTVRAVATRTPLSTVALAANPPAPRLPGTPITLSALAAGGETIAYSFRVGTYANSQWSWTTLRNWAPARTCTWTPSTPGAYLLVANARDLASNRTVTGTLRYIVLPELSRVRLTAYPHTPQPVSTPVLLTAIPIGGLQVEYCFRVGYQDGDWHWTTLRDYSVVPTCAWRPSRADVEYTLEVKAREVDSTAPPQVCTLAFRTISRGITANLAAGLPSPQSVGTRIPLSASSSGQNIEYRFRAGYVANNVWNWTIIQDYSASSTCVWTPAGAHLYQVQVMAREAGAAYLPVTKTLPFLVRPALSAVNLAVSPPTPQPNRTTLTLTAIPHGGVHLTYQFMAGYAYEDTWRFTSDLSDANTWTWTPPTPGAYRIRVVAYDANGINSAEDVIDPYVIKQDP